MNIQINTDHNTNGGEALNSYIKEHLLEKFDRFKLAITRIEVHLSDENAQKTGGGDKRCLLEARVSNYQPVVVSSHADTIHLAIEGASDKLLRSLKTMVGKLTHHESPKELYAQEEVETDLDVDLET